MEDVDLAVCAVGPHDVLLDWFADSDLLYEIVKGGLRIPPLIWRDHLDNARLHSIAVDFCHLSKSKAQQLANKGTEPNTGRQKTIGTRMAVNIRNA